MAAFPLKSQLPVLTQNEIDRVQAIDSTLRNATEAAFLVSVAPYLSNEVMFQDVNDLIIMAAGNTLPTGLTGFKKGALFIKKNASGNGLYNNTGDETSATWNLIDQADTADIPDGSITTIKIADLNVTAAKLAATLDLTSIQLNNYKIEVATPVNAVAASKQGTFTNQPANNGTISVAGVTYTFQLAIGAGVAATGLLTVSGPVAEGDQIQIGGVTYKLRAAIGAGAKAAKTLSLSDVAINNETVVIDTTTYTFKTALTEAKATTVLTATANPQDGARATIGSTTYTFRDTLATAFDVKIGVSANASLANLLAAINLSGTEGVEYGAGTTVHPTVVAADGAGDTLDITAKTIGVAGNALTSVEFSPGLAFTSGTMAGGLDSVANEVLVEATAEANIDNLVAAATGGAGAGTKYSTATVAHTTVDVTKGSASTVVATAKSIGFAGNAIAIDETLTNGSWAGAAVFLSGGVDAQAANDVLIGANAEASIDNLVLAITHGATEGTNYGTGTVVHPSVTAVKASAATMTVTALSAGDAGNSISTTDPVDDGTVISFGATTLTGGEGAEAANDILIDDTAEHTLDNLIAAINKTAGEGTKYGTGTVINPTVTATKQDTDKITVTAKVKGVAGNSVVIAENATNFTWAGAATALSSGVDGTVGLPDEIVKDESYLYVCLHAGNTIAQDNWRRITLGSAY